MRKRILFICVAACILALAFSSIAVAKYAGYAYNNPIFINNWDPPEANPNPGYLSWTGANAIYKRANNTTANQDTPHGGYVTTTTKCAVCHSAHRAYSAKATAAGETPTNNSLTFASACVNCHTAWGAGPANKKIEWANIVQAPDSGGPHSSFGCTAGEGRPGCHTGGIHGSGNSVYHGMNAFLLGNQKDADIAAGVAAGNINRFRFTPTPLGGGFANAGWFFNGTTNVPAGGGMPSNFSTTDTTTFAAAKGNATAYTCSQSGCHTSSQFAVNVWGFSANRAGDPRNGSDMNTPMTGHGVGTMFSSAPLAINGRCGPCHAGNYSGGWRYETNMVVTPNPSNSRAYGCDQCHDMIGQLTNTTAWPHGNRNIKVWEWDKDGKRESVDQASGNLWMYSSNIARITPYDQFNMATAYTPTDASYRVIDDATGYDAATGIGNINDGVCLKCHVAVDAGSRQALGGSATGPINPAVGNTHQDVNSAGVFKLPVGFSKSLWIYK